MFTSVIDITNVISRAVQLMRYLNTLAP